MDNYENRDHEFSDNVDNANNYNKYQSEYNTSHDTEARGDSSLREASFYKENYVKPEKKKGVLGQLIIVAVISSILGGSTVGAIFQFAVPAIQPSIKSYLGDVGVGSTDSQNSLNSKASSDIYKKVVIESAESPVVAIAEKVGPSVVGISVVSRVDNFFFGPTEVPSSGSGIIIRSDGYIMTNNHVVEQALGNGTNEIFRGSKIEVILPNNKEKPYTATVVGRDVRTDLAVLKIDAVNLPAVEMGNSDDVKVGELAVAIGNPGGLEYMGSVTVGVISGLNRTIPIADGKELKLIQTDASINPGNSGGALVNSKGQLIGINTAKIGGDGYEGLGFAIPVNKAKEITDSLIEFRYVKGRPSIGIVIESEFDEEAAKRYGVPEGVLVKDVTPFSGAYKSGIQRSDIITKLDGIKVTTFDKLNELKNQHKPGETIKLEIYRDGETLTVEVVLGEEKY